MQGWLNLFSQNHISGDMLSIDTLSYEAGALFLCTILWWFQSRYIVTLLAVHAHPNEWPSRVLTSFNNPELIVPHDTSCQILLSTQKPLDDAIRCLGSDCSRSVCLDFTKQLFVPLWLSNGCIIFCLDNTYSHLPKPAPPTELFVAIMHK